MPRSPLVSRFLACMSASLANTKTETKKKTRGKKAWEGKEVGGCLFLKGSLHEFQATAEITVLESMRLKKKKEEEKRQRGRDKRTNLSEKTSASGR